MTPTLTRVVRLDSLPLNQTYYTKEGYLIDRPILTSTGIFEYHNPDGTIRRELRLPEDVFDTESLKSFKAKPVIITHDAGLVDKDNVAEHSIGTILTEGYRSGDDVRAEIVIHDTDAMREAGIKELSLGYDLDLEETPGEWNGQPYDGIQRNIRINHLALVREARAGDQARLNIDSRDPENILKGGKSMSKTKAPEVTHRSDGNLSAEELAKAIEEYKARYKQPEKADSQDEPTDEPVVNSDAEDPKDEPVEDPVEEPVAEEPAAKDSADDDGLEAIKDRQDKRNCDGEPDNLDEAKKVINQQDSDMKLLFDIIDTLLAQADFKDSKADSADEPEEDPVDEPDATDGKDCDPDNGDCGKTDGCGNKDGEEPVAEENTDGDEPEVVEPETKMNADSVDEIVRQRVKLGMLGHELHMDGLEDLSITEAKKKIVGAINPKMNLDGKSNVYVDAAYDMAVAELESRKENAVDVQRQQMFNNDSAHEVEQCESASDARNRMIARQMNKNKEEK